MRLTLLVASLASCTPAAPTDEAPVRPVVEAQAPTAASAQPASAPLAPIASYETRYAPVGPRAKNIELAASMLAGGVLLAPGDTFSFNDRVGPRDGAHGFLRAPVIADGEMRDGEGGGVCQVSSTLHAAARRARLTIVERAPHSRPMPYIAPGLDAAVSYPSEDLRVRDDLAVDVILAVTARSGQLTAEVLADATDSGAAAAAAPVYSYLVGSTGASFAHRERTAAAGQPCPRVAQAGTDGRIFWSKLTFPDGSRDAWRSVYAPTDEVLEVCP